MWREETFSVIVDDRNSVTRIAPQGDLDMATAPKLTAALHDCESRSVSIMVDLRNVTFMDASGLHAFLEARDRASSNGHRLLFVGASLAVRRVFQLTGLESVLDEHDAISTITRFAGTSTLLDTPPADSGDLRA